MFCQYQVKYFGCTIYRTVQQDSVRENLLAQNDRLWDLPLFSEWKYFNRHTEIYFNIWYEYFSTSHRSNEVSRWEGARLSAAIIYDSSTGFCSLSAFPIDRLSDPSVHYTDAFEGERERSERGSQLSIGQKSESVAKGPLPPSSPLSNFSDERMMDVRFRVPLSAVFTPPRPPHSNKRLGKPWPH